MYVFYLSKEALLKVVSQLLYLLTIVVATFVSSIVYANNSSNPPVNVNLLTNNLLYQQQVEESRSTVQKNLTNSRRERSKPKVADIAKRQQALIKQKCLPYSSIFISGATLIDTKRFEVTNNPCISELLLNKINRKIIKAYLDKGYAQAKTSFATAHNKTALVIAINEGVVAHVRSDNKDININTLLPHTIGKPLKIADLDQAIDHTSVLRGSSSKVDIYPNKNGTIDVELSSTASKPISGEVSIDNNGSEGTGKWVGRFNTRIDSPLNLSDSLTVSGSQSLQGIKSAVNSDNNAIKQDSKSLAVNYSVPYGYWKFGAYGSVDSYENPVILPKSGAVKQSGDGKQIGASAEYTFSRGAKHVSKITTNVEKVKKNSYFADSRVEVQSPVVKSAKVGVNSMLIRPKGMIFVDGYYEKGIDTSKANPTGNNYKLYGVNADAYFYHGKLKKIDATWRNQHKLRVAHSDDNLPAMKKTNLLSPYSVRGFSNSSDNANTSASLQSTYFVTTQYKDWQVEPYVGMDIAVNTNKKDGSKKAVGTAIGVSANKYSQDKKTAQYSKDYEVNVEYAKGKVLDEETKSEEDVSMKLKWLF